MLTSNWILRPPCQQEEDGEHEAQRFDDERLELQEWLHEVEARCASVSNDEDGGDDDGEPEDEGDKEVEEDCTP